MTPQRQRVLDFILAYQEQYGRRPTYEQISEGLGIAVMTVCNHVTKLEKAGEIQLIYAAKKSNAARA